MNASICLPVYNKVIQILFMNVHFHFSVLELKVLLLLVQTGSMKGVSLAFTSTH